MNKYSYTKESLLSFEETKIQIIKKLKEQWFGLSDETDMRQKLFDKIWKKIDYYIILWVCNPKLAYKALEKEQEIWLFLPCKVLVYQKNNKIFISVLLPKMLFSITGNDELLAIAQESEDRLIKAVDNFIW